MRTVFRLSVSLVAAGLVGRVAAGCSSGGTSVGSAADAGEARSSSPCSDGPAYSWDHPFPLIEAPPGYIVNESDHACCSCRHRALLEARATPPQNDLSDGVIRLGGIR